MSGQPGILFTAFEPSGDALAAGLITELRRSYPQVPISGVGGPRMRDAGARMLQTTTEHAVMLLGAVSQIRAHRSRLAMLRRWLSDNELLALIPVDSPAANWSVCRLVRRLQPEAKIVHLAAPQLWAWAPWRIRKLRRLTDHVLCLLPFEPEWFGSRGVSASFVGHPIFDAPIADDPPTVADRPLPPGRNRKIVLLPGSRAGEIRSNLPAMVRATAQLQQRYPDLRATVCAVDAEAAESIHAIGAHTVGETGWVEGFHTATGQLDRSLRDADLACVVSGTVTLNVARAGTPMVVVYRINRLSWNLIGRWLVRTRIFTLPNLIAQADGRPPIVPELIPYFGTNEPLVSALDRLLNDPAAQAHQKEMLGTITAHYLDAHYRERSVEQVCRMLGL